MTEATYHPCMHVTMSSFSQQKYYRRIGMLYIPRNILNFKTFNINFFIILKQRFQVANFFVMPFTIRWIRGKESACQAGDVDSISGLGRSPREGNGNPFQHDILGNPMDRVA